MTSDTFDESELRGEIDRDIEEALKLRRHHNALSQTPEQMYLLVQARDRGVEWKTIVAMFHKRGWAGSEPTLRRSYQKEKERKQNARLA